MSANACGFHNFAPQPTLVDRLLASDQIVLARPAQSNPFRFDVIEVLEGSSVAVELPHLVDSNTRRQLAKKTSAAVLFAREAEMGTWNRLVLVDKTTNPIVRKVMGDLEHWRSGETTSRFSYFAQLVNHPDARVHQLALRELDQADYSALRLLNVDVPAERLLIPLEDMTGYMLRPIRVLLLGQSEMDGLGARLISGLKSSVIAQAPDLGAFATAYIEYTGAKAVSDITETYLMDRRLPLLTREMLLEAMSLHADAPDPAVQKAIVSSVETVLWVEPGLAGAVARKFGSQGDWTYKTALSAVLDGGGVNAFTDRQDVLAYLSRAEKGAKNP
ncbi:MAG: hypothetical protein AAGI36_05995 [Pseudomonadota bacterium]